MDSTDEQKIIKDFIISRSEAGFKTLYLAHTPMIFRMAVRMTYGNTGAAEDIVQEAWIRAVTHLNTFQFKSTFKTWLSAITINCCREHLRKNHNENHSYDVMTKEPAISTEPYKIDLQKALQELPEGYREAFILHDMEGYTHREIGIILNITEGTSKSQLFNARRAMRKILSDIKEP